MNDHTALSFVIPCDFPLPLTSFLLLILPLAVGQHTLCLVITRIDDEKESPSLLDSCNIRPKRSVITLRTLCVSCYTLFVCHSVQYTFSPLHISLLSDQWIKRDLFSLSDHQCQECWRTTKHNALSGVNDHFLFLFSFLLFSFFFILPLPSLLLVTKNLLLLKKDTDFLSVTCISFFFSWCYFSCVS